MKMNRRNFLLTTATTAISLTARAADSQPRLRVAVIGHTGRGNYGHGLDTMWQRIPETEIVTVADPDAKGLEAAQKKLKVTKGFADYRRMLAETKPDIVAIAPRYIDRHRELALAAIESGARGVYMEKPFCRTAAEANEIVAACEKRKVKVALAHCYRYHPAVAEASRLVKEGAIGTLLELRGRGKEDTRGGVLDFWVLGSHVMNLALCFGGKPLASSAAILQDTRPVTRADVQEGAEGVGPVAGNRLHARFEMERGVPFYFDSIKSAGNRAASFGLQVIGSTGIIDFRVAMPAFAHLVPGSPFLPPKEQRSWIPITSAGLGKPEPVADLDNQVKSQIHGGRDLVAAIRENRPPLSSAQDGRTVVEMTMAAFESHRLGGKRVTLPLQEQQNPLAKLV